MINKKHLHITVIFTLAAAMMLLPAISAQTTQSCSGTSSISCGNITITNSTFDVGQNTTLYVNGISAAGLLSGTWSYSNGNITTKTTSSFKINASSLGNWHVGGAKYPWNATSMPCVVYSSTAYCIGGEVDNGTYVSNVLYGSIGANGISSWLQYANYPIQVYSQSCVADNQTIYCIGGQQNADTYLNNVYYSKTSSNSWGTAPSYPFPDLDSSCNADGNVIYCVGGYGTLSGYPPTNQVSSGTITVPVNSVYAANELGNGNLGPWHAENSYPQTISKPSCNIYNGTIFCVGTNVNLSIQQESNVVTYSGNSITDYTYNEIYTNQSDVSYYAPIGAGGIDTWKKTSAYPDKMYGESCAINGDVIYCINGQPNFGSSDPIVVQNSYSAYVNSR